MTGLHWSSTINLPLLFFDVVGLKRTDLSVLGYFTKLGAKTQVLICHADLEL